MKINQPSLSHEAGSSVWAANIEYPGGSERCFYSVPVEYESLIDTATADCFVLAMIYPALRRGEDILVDYPVSEKLLFSLNTYFIPMIMMFDRRMKRRITVEAAEIYRAGHPEAFAVGTGFSGGLDSFCTIYDHFEQEKFDSFRLSHLFLFNVGSHGIATDAAGLKHLEEKFMARYAALKPYPDEIGLPFVPVNSNVHAFHIWGHLEVGTYASLSAALFLQRGLKKYYLSSSGHTYKHLFGYIGQLDEYADAGMFDPLTLPLFSTENLDFIADGTQYDRSQKLERVADYPPLHKYINVCAAHDVMAENCSICYKCCRTMLTLELLGKLDGFADVFDLGKYRSARKRFIASTLVHEHDDMFSLHIMDLARRQHVDLRREVGFLDLLQAKMQDGKLHNLLRRNPLLKKGFKLIQDR